MAGDGEVEIVMPGSGVVIVYASQAERDRSELLARARQALAVRTGLIPSWTALSEADRETAILEARGWLRAAVACGLTVEEGTDGTEL